VSSTTPLAPGRVDLRPRPGPDPVGGFVSGQHVADAGDPAVWAADHGEPLKGEGGPGPVSQEMFQTLTLDTQLETKERDPDTRVY
jgi:hypothetical protein